MSGIVGSKLNIRGSGRIAKLGTDGQVLTSSGPGVQANYEDAAGGGLDWQSVVTASTFTAVAGNGYPVNTTSNACTVTLPASASVGDEIIFTDYLRTWATNNLTINQNSLNYQGNSAINPVYDTNGESIHIVYVDATQGWTPTYDGSVAYETDPSYECEYLMLGGGGGSGRDSSIIGIAGGAGAGGYRTNYGGTAIDLTAGVTYTVTVGTGGAIYGPAAGTGAVGNDGVDSSLAGTGITTITATGGGASTGGDGPSYPDSNPGGSGGGGGNGTTSGAFGTGNAGGDGGSPSIPEGYNGSNGLPGGGAGGGGGATEAGGTDTLGYGGDGTSNSITGSAVTYGGGGSGAAYGATWPAAAGDGGGGTGANYSNVVGTNGTDGLGGGAGGVGNGGATDKPGTTGGDGIVILRMATADKGTPSGEDSSAVDGSDTVITWLATGSYVA